MPSPGRRRPSLWIPTAVMTAILATACGGGSSTATNGTTSAPTGVTISGVAATGAALGGATISVVDSTGAVVSTATAGADGSYSLNVPLTAKAPFVISAVKDEVVLYAPVATSSTGTINITPLTN